ncbi:MAG: hypothetical protein HYY58_02560, partial [Candidatus Omnitrophica bacterium]|nr:hypothetical protein [Candidatus Omnitrophota bacterium]
MMRGWRRLMEPHPAKRGGPLHHAPVGATSRSPDREDHPFPHGQVRGPLVFGIVTVACAWLSVAGVCAAASSEPSAQQDARADPQPQAGEEAKRPLTPMAQQYLEAAKARLEAERAAQAQRERARQREQAQQLAIQISREKLKQQAAQEREAQRQVRLARERQLKTLYQKALSLYQRGAYPEAAETLQQMVVLDPAHPLVKAADRLIERAELKHFEQRLRASAKLPPQAGGANVSGLEQLLAQKRMELETVLKYAKSELQAERYDAAEKLLTAILVQDPSQRQAQQLLEQVQQARLKEERVRLTRSVERDEEAMVNEVMRAQVLPDGTQHSSAAAAQQLTQAPRELLSAKLTQPVSFHFRDVPLSDVIEFISDAANLSIIPSPRLDLTARRVSLTVNDLPLEQAVKYLARSLSLAYRVEPDAILIAAPEEFSSEPLETRVFFLRNGLGPFALATSAVEPNPALAMESITHLIEQAIPQVSGSKLVMDERSGALIVTNTTQNLALVERLLSQLDVTPTQVLIEARFV